LSQYLVGCGGSSYSAYSPDTRDASIVADDQFKLFKSQFEAEFGTSSLPNCKGSSFATWSNCFGVHDGSGGFNRYIGEFIDGKYNGKGIRYFRNNEPPSQIGLFKNDSYIHRSGKEFRNGMLLDYTTPDIQTHPAQLIEKKQFNEVSTEKTINSNSNEKSLNKELTIDMARTKCSELGFKQTTEGFGKCVLQLTK